MSTNFRKGTGRHSKYAINFSLDDDGMVGLNSELFIYFYLGRDDDDTRVMSWSWVELRRRWDGCGVDEEVR